MDHDDAVDVVGHDAEGVGCDVREPAGEVAPGGGEHVAGGIRNELAGGALAEQAQPVLGADGDEVGAVR